MLEDNWINIFRATSEHPYSCTCDSCRYWWMTMGPDTETGMFGPFGMGLWEEYALSVGLEVRQSQLGFASYRYYRTGKNILPQLFNEAELVYHVQCVLLPQIEEAQFSPLK